MLYRVLPRGGEKISVIGLGASSLHEAGKAAVKVVETALEAGINFIEKTLSTLIQWPVSFESGLNWFQPCASFESGFTFAQ